MSTSFAPPVDQAARNQAMDPHQSLIVSAPAGSGKTYLLTRRILNLMMHVEHPSQVVAITFTKKAALEMQERLIQCLEKADEDIAQQVLKRSKEKSWDIFNQELSIMTIDAYCAWLLSHTEKPVIFPVSQSPQDLYQMTILSLYQQPAWSPSQTNLLKAFHGQYQQLEALLISLLATRDQWRSYLNLQDLAKHCKQGIEMIVQTHLLNVSNDLAPYQPIISTLFTNHTQIAHQLNEPPVFTPSEDQQKHLVQLANMVLTQTGQPRKSFNKRQGIYPKTRVNEAVSQIQRQFLDCHTQLIDGLSESQLQALHQTRLLPTQQDPDEVAFLNDLSEVLTTLLSHLEQQFFTQQSYDFTEIALQAIHGLRQSDELKRFCQANIHHVLIDEFQDTSATQYHLLKALIEIWPPSAHRTLFAVGDPMQSIYRFRQADVRLFLTLQQNPIAHISPSPVFLQCNFRSSTKVIEQINHLFKFILPDSNLPYHAAITYSDATPTQPQAPHHGIFVYQEQSKSPSAQANQCIQLIQQLQKAHPGERIAILVQARSHLKQILPALEANQIAYNAIDIYPTVNLTAIQDLTALLSAIIDPYDYLSWFTVLRSPLCGLSMSSLAKVSTSIDMMQGLDTLSHELEDSDDFAFFSKFYNSYLTSSQHSANPVHRVWCIWTQLLGAELYPKDQSLAIENWFIEVDKRYQENLPLHRDATLKHFSSSFTSKTATHATVELLTAHKSKGLEYDHVIIPHLEKKKPPASTPLFYCEPGDAPIIQPAFTQNQNNIDYFKTLNKTRDSYESMRLFYVACTRAKSTLHLMGHMEDKPNSGSWFEAVWHYLESHSNIKHITLSSPESLTHSNQAPILKRSLNHLTLTQSNQNFTPNSLESRFGTALHYYMQHITHHDILRKWQYYLLKQGFLPCESKLIHERSNRIQHHFESSQHFKWIMKQHAWAHNEWEIMHHGETFILDRVFYDGQSYVIIDYKFPHHAKSLSQEVLLNRYQDQLQTYFKILQDYLQNQNITKNICCFLYLPEDDRLIEYTPSQSH